MHGVILFSIRDNDDICLITRATRAGPARPHAGQGGVFVLLHLGVGAGVSTRTVPNLTKAYRKVPFWVLIPTDAFFNFSDTSVFSIHFPSLRFHQITLAVFEW